jgi:hypothetical protein
MRKNIRILTILLLVLTLLLSGCAGSAEKVPETKATETPVTTAAPEVPETTQMTEVPEPVTEPDDELADASLVSLRQTMVETPQRFAVAYFGFLEEGQDPRARMAEAAPQLCENLPFLMNIQNVAGSAGELFCLVPLDETASVAVNGLVHNEETGLEEYTDLLYRSETGDPLLILCNNSGWEPDTQVTMVDSEGNVILWYPQTDLSGCVLPLYDENDNNQMQDFSAYAEFLAVDRDGGSQSLPPEELVGGWELAWTEVEGDRNEAEPGSCCVEIRMSASSGFLMTYTSREFSHNNFENELLIFDNRELYYGCGNDAWVGDLDYVGPWDTTYTVTLTVDDILIKQNYFLVDGAPMVSYEFFRRSWE